METSLCCNVSGFRTACVRAGIKEKTDGEDFGIIVAEKPVPAAGVFTLNSAAAAPVKLSRLHLNGGSPVRAVLVNSGNANACTGREGRENCLRLGRALAEGLDTDEEHVLYASTGVIGHQIPVQAMLERIPLLIRNLDNTAGFQLARTIMTTDTVPKWSTVHGYLGGRKVTVSGIAKGSGMIAPNMATMLGFVLTDAAVSSEILRKVWSDVTSCTFNRVTVDSDTSTNDTAIILASGKAGNSEISSEDSSEYARFRDLLFTAVNPLAKAIARDGEGATKLVKIEASGFGDDESCSVIARAIAESPLVKTALFGSDPNWGRIVAAAGKTGVDFSPENISVHVSGTPVLVRGTPVPFDRALLKASLDSHEVYISIQGNAARGYGHMYTCDYSYDYIKINAEYHT